MPQRSPRLPANGRVKISGVAAAAWTVNWSPRGSCILVEGELPETDHLHVEFLDRYTWGEAEVVWKQSFPDGCLAGLQFIRLERGASRDGERTD